MENIEIEYKVMIDKKGYEKLLNHFNGQLSSFKQTNYYFDSIDEKINKNKLSLRIREKNNKYIVTLKEPYENGRLEHEYVVKNNELASFPSQIINLLNKYDIKVSELYNFATLTTIRNEIKIDDSLLCIDYSTYNEMEDYEVECESNSLEKGQAIIENLLNSLSISYTKSTLSKTARAKKANIKCV